jgi:[ribosomal protein S5]-alanine N-acetyltransferase
MIRLETERLIFHDWQDADGEPFHAICSDPAVMQFVGDGEPWPREKTKRWLKDSIETAQQHGYCRWALVLKETSALIGFCGFVPAGDDVEIGWRLARGCWGQGLATEAARAALQHGFKVLGFRRVIALVQSPNLASQRVCEKLGMTFDHTVERHGRELRVYSISTSAIDPSGPSSSG